MKPGASGAPPSILQTIINGISAASPILGGAFNGIANGAFSSNAGEVNPPKPENQKPEAASDVSAAPKIPDAPVGSVKVPSKDWLKDQGIDPHIPSVAKVDRSGILQ